LGKPGIEGMGIKAQIINRLLAKNYYLARIVSQIWFKLNFDGKQLLIVYQMGKVGSTTIVESLKAWNSQAPVLQVHVLSQEAIQKAQKGYYGESRSVFRGSQLPETKHLFLSYYLRSALNSNRANPRWKIITLVREPLAVAISLFFFSVDTHQQSPFLPDFYSRYYAGDITSEQLAQRFLEVFGEGSNELKRILCWFETEFKTVSGVDVYSFNFPKEAGYQLFQEEFADVLLLKLERLDQCYGDAFKQFLQVQNFRLVTANTASRKRYYPAFKEFMQSVRLPREYLDAVYGSDYVRHFYTDEEIDSFRRTWRGPNG
jgi:hypothetical protein